MLFRSTETLSNLGALSATPTSYNLNNGTTFYHSSTTLGSNWTANFTNVPTTTERTILVTIFVIQGATPYIPNAVQIDGAAQTLKWSQAAAPTGTANQTDVFTFALMRISSAWGNVLGSYNTFG